MRKTGYKPPKIDYSKRRKSMVQPDQSLSIKEIVKRYVRGIPVDVVKRDGVYLDQQDDDLEKLSRMDFGEKAMYADALAERAQQLHNELRENERNEVRAKEEAAQKAAEEAAKAKA